MAISYFVRYETTASDVEKFVEYYEMEHTKFLAKFPGIQGLQLHTQAPSFAGDSQTTNVGSTSLLAQLTFPSIISLETALQSNERRMAREDMSQNFPPFDGLVTHQAMLTRTIF